MHLILKAPAQIYVLAKKKNTVLLVDILSFSHKEDVSLLPIY